MSRRRIFQLASVSLAAVISGLVFAADSKPDASADVEVTGVHRGYANDELNLRMDDDREVTFLVRIPGDDSEKWHKDFRPLSRITVTFHKEPGAELPIATAIRSAPPSRR